MTPEEFTEAVDKAVAERLQKAEEEKKKTEDEKKKNAQGQQSKTRAAADDDDDAELSKSTSKQSRSQRRKKQKSEARVMEGAGAPRHQEHLTLSSGRETYSGVEAYGFPIPSSTPHPLPTPTNTSLPPPVEISLPVPPYWHGTRYQEWIGSTMARQATLYNEWISSNRTFHGMAPIPEDLPSYLWPEWITAPTHRHSSGFVRPG